MSINLKKIFLTMITNLLILSLLFHSVQAASVEEPEEGKTTTRVPEKFPLLSSANGNSSGYGSGNNNVPQRTNIPESAVVSRRQISVNLLTREDEAIVNFLHRVSEDVRNQEMGVYRDARACGILSSRITGGLFGAISAVFYYNLGDTFWSRIVKNRTGVFILNSLGVVPLFALNTRTGWIKFGEIADTLFTSEEEDCVTKRCGNISCASILAKGLELGLALAGSVGSIYLVQKYYDPPMGKYYFFLFFPTLISMTTTLYWNLENNVAPAIARGAKRGWKWAKEKCWGQRVEEATEDDPAILSIEQKRKKILQALTDAEGLVSNLAKKEVKRIRDDFLSQENPLLREFLEEMGTMKKNVADAVSRATSKERRLLTAENIVSWVGWGIGAVGSYTMEPLTEFAASSFLSQFGVTDPTVTSAVSRTIGWMGYVGFGSLTSFVTKKVFRRFFREVREVVPEDCSQVCTKESCSVCRSTFTTREGCSNCANFATNFILFGISGCSSVPRMESAIEYVPHLPIIKTIMVGACGVGRTCLDYWSLDEFKKDLLGKEKDKKAALLFLSQLQRITKNMKDEYIEALYSKAFLGRDRQDVERKNK